MGRFIGAYGALEDACRRAADAAMRQIPVFLNGEKGVGKETLARKIAKDANRPFQSLRASRLKNEEWTRLCEERELFFGRVLYLSELERVPKRFARRIVGAAMENALPFLLVASSETPYGDLGRDRNFPRETLAFLAASLIELPALRERKDELPLLAQLFLDDAALRLGAWPRRVELQEIEFLAKREWPDNLDGLRRAARFAAKRGFFGPDPEPTPQPPQRPSVARPDSAQFLAAASGDLGKDAPFPTLDENARAHIEAALRLAKGVVEGKNGAAALLAINPYTLRARMRKLGVDWAKFRQE